MIANSQIFSNNIFNREEIDSFQTSKYNSVPILSDPLITEELLDINSPPKHQITNIDYISFMTDYFIVFLVVLTIALIVKYFFCFKINRGPSEILSVKNLINVDIGLVLSKKDLEKYYEIKKLEFFNCLININKNYNDDINYDYIISNYKKNLDYLRNCLELKNENEQRNNSYNINDSEENNKVKENTIDPGLIYNNENLMMKGDPSYNLAFLENYEAYSIFDLLY